MFASAEEVAANPTAQDAAAASNNSKSRPKPWAQAVWLQDLIRTAAESDECTPAALAQLARAWDVLEARKSVIRGHGPPKPVPAANDPTTAKQRRRRSSPEPRPEPVAVKQVEPTAPQPVVTAPAPSAKPQPVGEPTQQVAK